MAKKQYQFFQHMFNAMQDDKIENLLCGEGMEGYGIFWGLLELLGQSEDYRKKTNYKSLAWKLHTTEEKIKRVVENYGLFVVEGEEFFSNAFIRQMEVLEDKYHKRAAAGKAGAAVTNSRKRVGNADITSGNADTDTQQCYGNAENVSKKKKNQKEKSDRDREGEKDNDLFPSNEAKNRCCCSADATKTTRVFDDRVDDEVFLRIVRNYMKKGATCPCYEAKMLIELMHPAWLSKDGRSFVGKEEDACCFWEIKRERKYIDGPRLSAAQCRVVDEFMEILSAAGVKDARVIDAFRGSEYDKEKNLLIWTIADKVFADIVEGRYLNPISAALLARYGQGLKLEYRILTNKKEE